MASARLVRRDRWRKIDEAAWLERSSGWLGRKRKTGRMKKGGIETSVVLYTFRTTNCWLSRKLQGRPALQGRSAHPTCELSISGGDLQALSGCCSDSLAHLYCGKSVSTYP